MGAIEQIKEKYRQACSESSKASKDAWAEHARGANKYTVFEPAYAAERIAIGVGHKLLEAIRAEFDESDKVSKPPRGGCGGCVAVRSGLAADCSIHGFSTDLITILGVPAKRPLSEEEVKNLQRVEFASAAGGIAGSARTLHPWVDCPTCKSSWPHGNPCQNEACPQSCWKTSHAPEPRGDWWQKSSPATQEALDLMDLVRIDREMAELREARDRLAGNLKRLLTLPARQARGLLDDLRVEAQQPSSRWLTVGRYEEDLAAPAAAPIALAPTPPMSMRDTAAIHIAGHLAAVRIELIERELSDVAVTALADASYRLADALGERSNHGRSEAPSAPPAKPPIPVPGPGRDLR